jgi:hypothetical protein
VFKGTGIDIIPAKQGTGAVEEVESKRLRERKSDTWRAITIFLGDLSDFEVSEVNTTVSYRLIEK